MRRFGLGVAVVVGMLLGATTVVHNQGSLSNQVLQLLSRVNTWTGSNTFSNLLVPCTTIPGSTAARLYADADCVLYFNGAALAGGGGGTTPHNLLSSTHPDTTAATVVRGDVITGQSGPSWKRLAAPVTTGSILGWNGTDVAWRVDGSALTNLTASNLVGTLPAISGVNLTSLNAGNLGSGTVPLARISGLLNAQIDAAASIAYSKLNLSGALLNADVNASAAIAYSKLALTGSVVNADISASAAIALSKLAQTAATSGQVIAWSGTAWAPAAPGSGTVTSVGLSLPAELTISNSPVTTTGTLTGTWATETTNKIFAAPSGSTGTPTFRAMVNADLPTSGVVAGSCGKTTVNAQGITTACGSVSLTADVTGILPRANGGTGVSAAGDDTVLIGSGTLWAPQTLTSGPLVYSTTTNGFTNTLLWGGATTGSNFAGGITDPTSTASGTVQNTEYTLNSIVIPASAFNASTRGVHIQAWGTLAANANAKNIKIYFGATAVATVTGSTANAKDYMVDMTVVRTGSSTQSGVGSILVDTGTSPTMAVTAALTEAEGSSITISLKAANTAAAAASATGKGMLLTFIN